VYTTIPAPPHFRLLLTFLILVTCGGSTNSSISPSFVVCALPLGRLSILCLLSILLLLLLGSLIPIFLTTASRYPCCPLTLLPGDPPPVLANALSVVPFSKELLWMPDSHPLSASVTEDSVYSTIPAPPHFRLPLGFFELWDWRGWRFHYSVGENRLLPRQRR